MHRLKKVNFRARLKKKKSTLSPELERRIRKISQVLNAPQQFGALHLDRESRRKEIAQILAEWDN